MSAGAGATGAVTFFGCIILLLAITAKGIQSLSTDDASLEILPQDVQRKPVGKSLVLTCRPIVAKPELISNLEWRDAHNRTISPIKDNTGSVSPSMYAEMMEGQRLGLVIPILTDNMAGNYHCVAVYSNKQKLYANVTIDTIVPVEWVNAPEYQYPIKGTDYKVKCEVKARPAPTVDWLRNRKEIRTNDKYVVETKGLLIKNVQEADDGVYTCRAIVTSTGEYLVKEIKLEVHSPPELEPMNNTVEVAEGETAAIKCRAQGKPPPSYEWIKGNNHENLAMADRFMVDRLMGTLTMKKVEENDSGPYTCIAKNSAGESEYTVNVEVIVKPKIFELENVTAEIKNEAKIICKASGRPAPQILFRKYGSPDYMVIGAQQNDDRITVDQHINNERGETFGYLTILNLKRSDDGLYECMASNKGDKAYKNGHITVHFPPTFEASLHQPPVWSWDRRPANLTCIAESIPNATIEWRVRDRPIEENAYLQIIGRGPASVLSIVPVDTHYYTVYKCVAKNPLGEAELDVELKMATRPGIMQQSKLAYITATSIKFTLVGPGEEFGLPMRAYLVRYKDEREFDWNRAMNKTWSINSPYTIENLKPLITYDFSFAAKNDVGLSTWGATQKYTMPNRSPPETPKLLQGDIDEAGVVQSPYADHFELRWKIPADNGEPIDIYEVTFCPVYKVNGRWEMEDKDACMLQEMKAYENTAFEMNSLTADTFYQIRIRAHNMIGYSVPEEMYIKTARGMSVPVPKRGDPALSSAAIIGIVIAGVFLMVVVVDLLLCCCRRQGVIATICLKKSKQHEEDEAKLGSLYGWRFPLPYCSNKEPPAPPSPAPLPPPVKLASTPTDEKEPLKDNNDRHIIDHSMIRNSSVEFDGHRAHAKTGEIIGKNSAV